MTREEKISRLKDIFSEINENDNAVCYLTSEDNELIESAIEALEQESILDKIRTEIEQEYKVESEHPYGQGLRRALEIIDKVQGRK
jgi:predicted RNA binding protein with dsRBD fold (UPF0201 family)